MLTFTSFATSLESGTEIWTLEFRYRDVCTNFVHPSGATTFSGRARLSGGEAWRLNGSTSVSLGTLAAMTVSVESPSFNPGLSQGTWSFFVPAFGNPYGGSYSAGTTTVGSGLVGTGWASVSFLGADTAIGTIVCILGNGAGNFRVSSSAFELERGGSCPV